MELFVSPSKTAISAGITKKGNGAYVAKILRKINKLR